MKKNIKMVVVSMIISLNFFIYESHNIITYALEEENKLDLLISNKKTQEELQSKIDSVNSIIEGKVQQMNEVKTLDDKDENNKSNEVVEVIRLSFVPDNQLSQIDIISEEISTLEDERKNLQNQLDESIIESVRIEKIIEEEKREFLKDNNLQFIAGSWPLESYKEISSPFGNRIHPITKDNNFHRGIDIPAPQYTNVLASDDGIVIFSGLQESYGNVVKIKHFDGKITVYAHNTSNIVKEGDIVKQGQSIAKVGSTGNSTGNHVHFEMIVNDKLINPINGVNK